MVVLGSVDFLHLSAFKDLEAFFDDLREFLVRMLFDHFAIDHREGEILHLFFCPVARETKMGGFAEDRLVIGDEVQGTLAGAKDVFCRCWTYFYS